MSTRACYTFKDKKSAFSVYYHYDGYPSNALKTRITYEFPYN